MQSPTLYQVTQESHSPAEATTVRKVWYERHHGIPVRHERLYEAPSGFPSLLLEYRTRARLSRNELGRRVGTDASYLTRIENGGREPPRLHIVDRLGSALNLSEYEHAGFRTAAGYTPLPVQRVGGWNPALQSVCDVMGAEQLSEDDREEFSCIVQRLAARWLRVS